jgi:cytochrome c553
MRRRHGMCFVQDMQIKYIAPRALLLAVGGCYSTAPVLQPKPKAEPIIEEKDSRAESLAALILQTHHNMHTRLDGVHKIGIAIALGQLGQAQTEARVVASIEDPNVLPEWQPFLARVRVSADELARTTDLGAAAKSAANLAALCGNCHEALGRPATIVIEPLLVTGSSIAADMARHQWAAARMWDGLVGPSDERWLQGSERLSTIHIQLAEKDTKLEIFASRIRHLALKAIAEPRGDGRTALFANLLASCADCHRAIRD